MAYNDIRTPEEHAAVTGNAELNFDDSIDYSVGHVAAAQMHGWEAHKRATGAAMTLIEGYYLEAITAALAGATPYAGALSPYAAVANPPTNGPGKHLVEGDSGQAWHVFADLALPANAQEVFDHAVVVHGYLSGTPATRVTERALVSVSRDGSGNAQLLSVAAPFTEARLRVSVSTSDITIDVREHASQDWVWEVVATKTEVAAPTATTFGPFASIAQFRAATPPSVDTECSIEGVGRGIYKPGSGANTIDDGMYVIKPTSVATASNGRFFLRQSITPSLPRYVYGRDAAKVISRVKDASAGVAIFAFGDSRTAYLSKYAGPVWTNIPMRGATATGAIGGLTPAVWTTYSKLIAAGETTASQLYPSETTNAHCLGAMEHAVTTGATVSELNHIWNRIWQAESARSDLTKPYEYWDTHDLDVFVLMRSHSSGIAASKIAIQAYANSNYSTAPEWQRSAYFGLQSATPALVLKKVTIPSAATLGDNISVGAVFSGGTMIVGESIQTAAVWLEAADGTGVTVHDYAVGGLRIEDLLNDTNYVVDGQWPESTLASVLPVRCGRKTPCLLLDIGTNGSYTSTHTHQVAQVSKFIERMRALLKQPNMPCILRNSYPSQTSLVDHYYRTGAITVAQNMDNVACFDTYGEAWDLGGYTYASAQGWMADTIHYSASGRLAYESRFDAKFI